MQMVESWEETNKQALFYFHTLYGESMSNTITCMGSMWQVAVVLVMNSKCVLHPRMSKIALLVLFPILST